MMNSHVHLVVATTLSMFMTLGFYCIFELTKANSSLIQTLIVDGIRDFFLSVRYAGSKDDTVCAY